MNDLCDQNQLLVQTVEDLEKESRGKVTTLERELCISEKNIKVLFILSISFSLIYTASPAVVSDE